MMLSKRGFAGILLGVSLVAAGCGSLQKKASEDPMKCERDPDCTKKNRANDCSPTARPRLVAGHPKGEAIRLQCTLCHDIPQVSVNGTLKTTASTVSPGLTPPEGSGPLYVEIAPVIDEVAIWIRGVTRSRPWLPEVSTALVRT